MYGQRCQKDPPQGARSCSLEEDPKRGRSRTQGLKPAGSPLWLEDSSGPWLISQLSMLALHCPATDSIWNRGLLKLHTSGLVFLSNFMSLGCGAFSADDRVLLSCSDLHSLFWELRRKDRINYTLHETVHQPPAHGAKSQMFCCSLPER